MDEPSHAALPPALRAALAIRPAPGDPLAAIEHVVILMQENRGFDHYFGAMHGVRGFSDRSDPAVFRQSDGFGGIVTPHPVDEEAIKGQPHDWVSGHEAWNGGRMDRWVQAKGAQTMSYCRREDIPFYYALADAFTICDAYHCSVLGPTTPNRSFLFSGTTGFEPWGDRAIENDAYDRSGHTGYTWTSYPERLQAAGVTWQVLQEWDNYGCNNLEFHASFKEIGRKALAATGFDECRYFYEALARADDTERRRLLALLDAGVAGLSASDRSLYDRALHRVPTGKLADAFRRTIAARALPKVTYLIPSQAECEHPDSGTDAATGVALAERLIETLASFPDVYAKTVFLLTYDENDGFFDHVPPPIPPPDAEGEEYVGGWPIGLGARVPMTVVSPWSRGGYVCSETFDHTSMVRFLERWTGVAEPNISAWRRMVCGDLTATLRGGHAAAVRSPARPTRPARALPYQPDAYLTAAGELVMTNTGSAAFQFAVLCDTGSAASPRRHDIPADSTVIDRPLTAARNYDLSCYGPNRFLRRFTGDLDTELALATGVDGSSLRLWFANAGELPASVTVTASYYQEATETVTVPAGGVAGWVWNVAAGDGWYDLTVTADVDPSWSRRLVGHIENGRDSVSG